MTELSPMGRNTTGYPFGIKLGCTTPPSPAVHGLDGAAASYTAVPLTIAAETLILLTLSLHHC